LVDSSPKPAIISSVVCCRIKEMADKKLTIYCDGGSRGNPGPAAAAYVVYDGNKKVDSGAKYLGKTTNNVAEYTSALLAIQWIKKNLSSYNNYKFLIIMDSQLVVKQLMGDYKIKNKNLKINADKIRKLKNQISADVRFSHVIRINNKEADRLVNKKMDDFLVQKSSFHNKE
jgi:ribonuclease HI